MRRSRSTLVAALAGIVMVTVCPMVCAETISLSTMYADVISPSGVVIAGNHIATPGQNPAFTWNYTGNYSDPRLNAYVLAFNWNNQVTVCPSGSCGSNGYNYGFSQTYPGYEFIYFGFSLPAGATNVSLHLDYVSADDRTVVDLNGHTLGAWGIYHGTLTGTQTSGGGTIPVTYAPNGGPLGLSFANQSWFLPGAENYIRFWINNTGTGIVGSPVMGSYNNPTALQTYGYITYDTATAVPEPASLLLLGAGLAGIAGRFCRKPRG